MGITDRLNPRQHFGRHGRYAASGHIHMQIEEFSRGRQIALRRMVHFHPVMHPLRIASDDPATEAQRIAFLYLAPIRNMDISDECRAVGALFVFPR